MSRVRTSSGHILSVQSRLLGSALDGAHTAGVTTLTVEDCSDFDDQVGGSLTLNGTTYAYSNVDDDAGTLTISPALAANASDGDDVTMLDPILGSPQYAVTASVTEDGEDPGDSIEADVASNLVEQLFEGIRGVAGEAVTLTWDEDDNPTVTGIDGLNDAQGAGVKFMQDELVVTALGDQTVRLTYTPITNSEHVYWNGVYQSGSEWSRAERSVTVPDPGSAIQVGDVLTVEYAYLAQAETPPLSIPIGTLWRYAEGLGSSTTYAAPGFDDSSWSQAATPLTYPTYAAFANVWQRIQGTTAGGDLTFTMTYTDNITKVYLDGVLIYNATSWSSTVASVTVPCPPGDHVFAVYSVDTDSFGGAGAGSGIEIEESP